MYLLTRSPMSNHRRSTCIEHAAALVGALVLCSLAQATEHSYAFTGVATVGARDGGPPVHQFTGLLTFNDDLPATTVYLDNSVVQGFKSSYALGSVSYLGITLDNGEKVEAFNGWLQVNNIQQAEIGSPVPADLSMQVWTSQAAGTINGYSIFNLYLAFLPVSPSFSWDGLDTYYGGNAERMLGDNPALLPATIDPLLTGTALPEHLTDTFVNGLFLGTNHDYTNTVNTVYTFTEINTPVPEPGTGTLLLIGSLLGWTTLRLRRAR